MITTSPRRIAHPSVPAAAAAAAAGPGRPGAAGPARRRRGEGIPCGGVDGLGDGCTPADAIIRIKRLGANPCRGGG